MDRISLDERILAMRMLLDQLQTCSAAIARDYHRVTLLDGKDHDVLRAWRETADSLLKVANEIAAIREHDGKVIPP